MGNPINPDLRAASAPRPRWTRGEELVVTPWARTVICLECGWTKHVETRADDGGARACREAIRDHRIQTQHKQYRITDAKARRTYRIKPPVPIAPPEEVPGATTGA